MSLNTKKIILALSATFLAALLFSNPALSASKLLSVTKYNQEKSQWCWVAGSQSIIKYHTGIKYSQCQLYKWGKGVSSCSGNKAGTLSEIMQTFKKAGLKNEGYRSSSSAAYSTIKSELNNSRPMLARIGWKSTNKKTGHLVPIRGYDESGSKVNWIYIRQSNSEYRKTSYSYLKDNSSWKWTHSIYGMK
jgi:hypothetical protein